MKEWNKSLFSALILHEKLLIVQKNFLFSDSSIGAFDSSVIELDTSQETLSASSEVGDSQETIPYSYTDDVGLRIRLSLCG